MSRKFAFSVGSVLFVCLIANAVQGCRNGVGARVKRSREGGQSPTEIDEELSTFFENCLLDAAADTFPSLKTTVDFAIKDTQWYKDVRDKVCTEDQDIPECWISTLPFLLDTRSPLYAPTAQCICDYHGGCWSMESSERFKRGVKSFSNTVRVSAFASAQCDPPAYGRPFNELEKSFSSCITTTSAKSYLGEKINGKSVTIFLDDHYTYCRRSLVNDYPYDQRVLFSLLFMDKVCPREGPESEWRKKVVVTCEDSLRKQAPIETSFAECKAEMAKKFGLKSVTDTIDRKKDAPQSPPVLHVDGCLVIYNDKCFKLIESKSRALDVKGFGRKCAKDNGRLANFYSTQHFERAITAIRESRHRKNTHLILGMRYDKYGVKLQYSDGSAATFEVHWRPGQPTNHPSHTTVRLFVDGNPAEPQGLYIRAPHFTRNFALCEYDL